MRLLLIAAAFIIMPHATAQISLCSGTQLPGGIYINFTPPTPNSMETVAIAVGRIAYDPHAISAQVHANSIDVTLTATLNPTGVPPPVACDTVTVGPLAAGSYTVAFFVIDPNVVNPVPFLAGTTTLVVASAFSPIPTTSSIALLALTLLMAAIAYSYHSSWPARPRLRSSRPRHKATPTPRT
jgi:hypothetical protein